MENVKGEKDLLTLDARLLEAESQRAMEQYASAASIGKQVIKSLQEAVGLKDERTLNAECSYA